MQIIIYSMMKKLKRVIYNYITYKRNSKQGLVQDYSLRIEGANIVRQKLFRLKLYRLRPHRLRLYRLIWV